MVCRLDFGAQKGKKGRFLYIMHKKAMKNSAKFYENAGIKFLNFY